MDNRQDHLYGAGSAIFFLLAGKFLLFLPGVTPGLKLAAKTRLLLGGIYLLAGFFFFYITFHRHDSLYFRLGMGLVLILGTPLIILFMQNGFYPSGCITLAFVLYPWTKKILQDWTPYPLHALIGLAALLGGLLLEGQPANRLDGYLLMAAAAVSLLALFRQGKRKLAWILLAWSVQELTEPIPWYENMPIHIIPLMTLFLTCLVNAYNHWPSRIRRKKDTSLFSWQSLALIIWGLTLFALAFIALHIQPANLSTERWQWLIFGAGIIISALFIYALWELNAWLNYIKEITGYTAPLPQKRLQFFTSLPTEPGYDADTHSIDGEPDNAICQTKEENIAQLERYITMQRQRIQILQGRLDLIEALHPNLDKPVASQIIVNMVKRLTHSALATVMVYDPKKHVFIALSIASDSPGSIPIGYQQDETRGIIGRAMRTRRMQVVQDAHMDKDYFPHSMLDIHAEVVVPIVDQGYINAVLVVSKTERNSFKPHEIEFIQQAAQILHDAWERKEYNTRRETLLQQSMILSRQLKTKDVLEHAVQIARHILPARFVFGVILSQDQGFKYTACDGFAPKLTRGLMQTETVKQLIHMSSQHPQGIHLHYFKQSDWIKNLHLDSPKLQESILLPLRIHEQTIGALMAFGTIHTVSFNYKDLQIFQLLGTQVASAIENTWLYEELTTTLRTSQRLHRLSLNILQSPSIAQAAQYILKTAYEIANARAVGIAIVNADGETLAQASLPADAPMPPHVPDSSLQAGEMLAIRQTDGLVYMYFPLQTHHHHQGILWIETSEKTWLRTRNSTALQTLTNNAAIALERLLLIHRTRQQARHLEKSYDETLAALMSALDARDRETEGHSVRVSALACELGRRCGLSPQELKTLERGALLHDIGKIGISDTILHKPGPLSEDEWRIMRQHPDIGARIVANIPFLRDTVPIIRFHQERWNGSGYPLGLKGQEIPLMARIFAVVDALDALTSNRPYRRKSHHQEAIAYIQKQAGTLFDPDIVAILTQLYESGEIQRYLEPDET